MATLQEMEQENTDAALRGDPEVLFALLSHLRRTREGLSEAEFAEARATARTELDERRATRARERRAEREEEKAEEEAEATAKRERAAAREAKTRTGEDERRAEYDAQLGSASAASGRREVGPDPNEPPPPVPSTGLPGSPTVPASQNKGGITP